MRLSEYRNYYNSLDKYKKAFWIYLVLIFVEGTMRKWFMPGLSSAWMMCREPIVIWTVLSLMGSKYLKSSVAKSFMSIGVIMMLTTLTIGHQNITVALFGFRIWFFHIPYIFIMSEKLNRKDLIMVCKFIILLFIPMTAIYVLQWASPVSSWINASVGGIVGEGGEGRVGALRPSGIFAHCVAASYYNPLVVCLFVVSLFSICYRNIWLSKTMYILLTFSIGLSLIVEVSRGAVVQSCITALFAAFMLTLTGKPQYLKKLIVGFFLIFVVFNILSNISIDGHNILEPITNRFETAAEQEGGTSGILESRIFEPYKFWNDKGKLLNPPLFGYGIGAGSNYGTQTLGLVSIFGNSKAWGLGEWSCQIVTNEMGFFFGGIVWALRLGFCAHLFFACYKKLRRNKDLLPICLWTLSVPYFGNGNINLTMTLGWIVVVMILLMLSIRTSEKFQP